MRISQKQKAKTRATACLLILLGLSTQTLQSPTTLKNHLSSKLGDSSQGQKYTLQTDQSHQSTSYISSSDDQLIFDNNFSSSIYQQKEELTLENQNFQFKTDYQEVSYSGSDFHQSRKLADISECASNFFPISIEDNSCIQHCEITGLGIVQIDDDTLLSYGSVNSGYSFLLDSTSKAFTYGIAFAMNSLAQLKWVSQIRLTSDKNDKVVAATPYKSDILILIEQQFEDTPSSSIKHALVLIASATGDKQSVWQLDYNQFSFDYATFSYITFEGQRQIMLSGYFFEQGSNYCGDLLLTEEIDFSFSTVRYNKHQPIDGSTYKYGLSGQPLSYTNTYITIRQYIKDDDTSYVKLTKYESNDGSFEFSWDLEQPVESNIQYQQSTKLNQAQLLKVNSQITVFVATQNTKELLIISTDQTGVVISGNVKLQFTDYSNTLLNIMNFQVEAVTSQNIDSYLILMQFESVVGFQAVTIKQSDNSLILQKRFGTTVNSLFGQFLTVNNDKFEAFYYFNAEQFAKSAGAATMVIGRMEIAQDAQSSSDLGQFDCTSLDTLIKVQSQELTLSQTSTPQIASTTFEAASYPMVVGDVTITPLNIIDDIIPQQIAQGHGNNYQQCSGGNAYSKLSQIYIDSSLLYDSYTPGHNVDISNLDQNLQANCQGYNPLLTFDISYDDSNDQWPEEKQCITIPNQLDNIDFEYNQCEPVLSYRQLLWGYSLSDDYNKKTVGVIPIQMVSNQVSMVTDLAYQCSTSSDMSFPKVLGSETKDMNVQGSQLVQDFLITCGQMDPEVYKNKNYYSDIKKVAFIMKTSINGLINWFHSGKEIYSSNSKFQSCVTDETNVYGLLWIDQTSSLALVTFDYETGDIKNVQKLPGEYLDTNINGLVIQDDSIYIYARRTDLPKELQFQIQVVSVTDGSITSRIYADYGNTVTEGDITTQFQYSQLAVSTGFLQGVGLVKANDNVYVHYDVYSTENVMLLDSYDFEIGSFSQDYEGQWSQPAIKTDNIGTMISAIKQSGETRFIKCLFSLDKGNNNYDQRTIGFELTQDKKFLLDLAINSDKIIDVFYQLESNVIYFASYLRSDITDNSNVQFKKITKANSIISNFAVFIQQKQNPTVANRIFTVQSQTNICKYSLSLITNLVSTSYSTVINQYSDDLLTTQSCITFDNLMTNNDYLKNFQQDLPLQQTLSPQYYTIYPAKIPLEYQTGIYFERKLQYQDINFQQATSCTSPIAFSTFEDLDMKQFVIGSVTTQIQQIVAPSVCTGQKTQISFQVDGDETAFDFSDPTAHQSQWYTVTHAQNSDNYEIIIQGDTTEDSIGLYTMQIGYTQGASTIYQPLVINIISSETEYDFDAKAGQCQSKSQFDYQIYNGTIDDSPKSGDISSTGLQLICGDSKTNALVSTKSQIFFELYTEYDYMVFHKDVRANSDDNTLVKCMFDPITNGKIWIGFNSKVDNVDVSSILQYDFYGNYVMGKTYTLDTATLVLQDFRFIDQSTLYLIANHASSLPTILLVSTSTLSVNKIQQIYTPKVNTQISFRRQLLEYQTDPIKLTNIDYSSGNIYALQYVDTSSEQVPQIVSIDINEGVKNWAINYKDGTNVKIITDAQHHLSIYNDYLYSCIIAKRSNKQEITIVQRGSSPMQTPIDKTNVASIRFSPIDLNSFSSALKDLTSCSLAFDEVAGETRVIAGIQYSYDGDIQTRLIQFQKTGSSFTKIENALVIFNQNKALNIYFKPLGDNIFNLFTSFTFTNNQASSTFKSLTKMKFTITETDLQWGSVQCDLMMFTANSMDFTSQYDLFKEDMINTYEQLWTDVSEQIRVKELPLQQYSQNFKAPSFLMSKTYDMSSQNFKDVRSAFLSYDLTTRCQAIQPIDKVVNPNVQDLPTFLFDGGYYNISVNSYTQCQDYKIDLSYTVDPSVGVVSEDDYELYFAIDTPNPQDYEIYDIDQEAVISQNNFKVSATSAYQVKITHNDKPTLTDIADVTMSYQTSKVIEATIGNQQSATGELKVTITVKDSNNQIVSSPAWLTKSAIGNDKKFTITISNHPSVTQNTVYTISVLVQEPDYEDTQSEATDTFTLTITANKLPKFYSAAANDLIFAVLPVNTPRYMIILESLFVDDDAGDTVTLQSCSAVAVDGTTAVSGVTFANYFATVGIPVTLNPSSYVDGDQFYIKCSVTDSKDTAVITLTVKISSGNTSPVWKYQYVSKGIYADEEFYLNSYETCSDLESDTITYKYYDKTGTEITENTSPFMLKTLPADNTITTLYIKNSADTLAANSPYKIRITCSDGQSGHSIVQSMLILQTSTNNAPIKVSDFSATSMFFKSTTLVLNKANKFMEADTPQSSSLTYYISTTNTTKTKPSFVSSADATVSDDNITFQIASLTSANVGTATYYVFAQDPRGATAYATLALTIQGCHASCLDCDGTLSTQCTSCAQGNEEVKAQPSDTQFSCQIPCQASQYHTAWNNCANCNTYCQTCKGSGATLDASNCQTCKTTAFTETNSGVQSCVASCNANRTYDSTSHICADPVAPVFKTGYTASLSTKLGATATSFDYELNNVQPSTTIVYDYHVYAGQAGTLQTTTDLKSSKTWITKADGTNKMTIKLGETVAIPDVTTANTPELYTIRLTMTVSTDNTKTTSLDIPLTLDYNRAPTINAGVSQTLTSEIVGKTVSRTISVTSFTDTENETITLACSKVGAADKTWFTVSSTVAGVVTVSATSPKDVTLVATYTVRCTVTDTHSKTNSYDFTLALNNNNAPALVPGNVPTSASVVVGGTHDKTFSNLCTDQDSDIVTYSIAIAGNPTISTTDTTANFYYNSTTSRFIFNYKAVGQAGSYTVTITCDDGYTGRAAVTTSYTITATSNRSPALTDQSVSTLPSKVLGDAYTITIQKSWYSDADGHAVSLTCSQTITPTPSLAFLSIASSGDDFVLTGTAVRDTNVTTTYNISCTASDSYGGTTSTIYTFVVSANAAPTIVSGNVPPAATVGISQTYTHDFTGLCTDTNAFDTLTYSLTANGTAVGNVAGNKLRYNSTTRIFTFDYSDTLNAGTLSIVVKCTDGVTTDGVDIRNVQASYSITAQPNAAPNVVQGTSMVFSSVVVGRPIDAFVRKTYFVDPESDTFTLSCLDNSYEWLHTDKVGDDYEITGSSPLSNTDWAGDQLTIACTVKDRYSNSMVYVFKQPLTTNSPPTISNSIPNDNVSVGQTYTKNFGGVCTDVDSDTLTYSVSINNVAVSSDSSQPVYFNSTTNILTYQHLNIANAGAKTIKVMCTDSVDTRNVFTTYTLTALSNAAPGLKQGVSQLLDQFVIGNKPISTQIKTSWFQDPEGDSFTVSCHDSYEWLHTDKVGDDYEITGNTPMSNDMQGALVYCDLVDSKSSKFTQLFGVPFTQNQAPTPLTVDVLEVRFAQTYSFDVRTSFSDYENDALTYTVEYQGVPVTTSTNRIKYNSTTFALTFTYASVADEGTFSVNVKCSDSITDSRGNRPAVKQVQFQTITNSAPYLKPDVNKTFSGSGYSVGKPFTAAIQKTMFWDFENDTFTLDCSQAQSWITLTKVGDDYTVSGQSPKDTSLVGDYNINCVLTDAQTKTRTIVFTIHLKGNAVPTFNQAASDKQISIGTQYIYQVTGSCSDSDNDSLAYTVLINNAEPSHDPTSPIFYNTSNETIVYSYSQISQSNQQYNVSISCSDGYNNNRQVTQTYKIIPIVNNAPAILDNSLKTLESGNVVYKPITAIIHKSYFADPEGDSFTLQCQYAQSWLKFNTESNGDITISGKTPADNSYSPSIQIPCTVIDKWTNQQSYTFVLPLAANTIPKVVVTPEIGIVTLGGTYERSFVDVCTDSDGDTLTYTMSFNGSPVTTNTAGAKLRYDSTTSTFRYNYATVSDNGDFTILVECTDGILVNSQPRKVSTTYTLSAQPNAAPNIISQSSLTLASQKVGKQISLQILKSWFTDQEGDSFTLTCTLTTVLTPTWLTVTKVGDNYSITGTSPLNNGLVQTIAIGCTVADSTSRSYSFKFDLTANQAPVVASIPLDQFVVVGSTHTQQFAGVCTDPESDTLTYSVKVDNVAVTDTTGSITKYNSTSSTFQYVYTVNNPGQHTIAITCTDGISGNTASTSYKLTATNNSPPTIINSSSLTLTAQVVGKSIRVGIMKSWFQDNDSTSFTLTSCSAVTQNSFLTIAKETDNFFITGTSSLLNTDAKVYQISCIVTDVPQGNTNTYTFSMEIKQNTAPTVATPINDQSVAIKDTYSTSFNNLFTDAEGDTLHYSVKINNTAIPQNSQFSYDQASNTLTFNYQTSEFVGTHTIQVLCTDGIDNGRTTTYSFKITGVFNQPVTVLRQIAPISIDIFTRTYSLDLSTYFRDPENKPVTYALANQDDSTLSTHITNFTDGLFTFNFTTQFTGAQIFQLKVVASDNEPKTTPINFIMIITGCSTRCTSCTDTGATTCTGCLDPYFLNFNTHSCDASCPDYTWPDDENNQCKECHDFCELCSGPDHKTQCSTCSEDAYKFQNGCLDRCPEGNYADNVTASCLQIQQSETINFAECQAFVDQMYSSGMTTDSQVLPFDEMEGQEITCNSAYVCHGSGSDTPRACTWTRKFAMQCTRNEDGYASLRVATNSMPDHCFDTSSYFPSEGLIDFEVAFNRQDKLGSTVVNSTENANQYRCGTNWLKDDQILKDYRYKGYGYDNLNYREQIVGVAFNGVPIMSAVSQYGVDPFYPKKYGTSITFRVISVDDCLGFSANSGFYHYYSASPCILSTQFKTNVAKGELCSNTVTCLSDVVRYLTNQYPKPANTGAIEKIGIARDGHYIIGPFNSTGKLWQPCDVDACNGVRIDGKYYYVATLFHPYTVGCWGSGSANTYPQQCSTRALVCVESSTGQTGTGTGTSSSSYTLMLSLLQLSIVSLLTILFTQL